MKANDKIKVLKKWLNLLAGAIVYSDYISAEE